MPGYNSQNVIKRLRIIKGADRTTYMHRLSRLFVVRIMHINRFSQYAAQIYIYFFLRILVHYYSFKNI